MPTPTEELFQRMIRPLMWSILAAILLYGISVLAGDIDLVADSFEKLGFAGWLMILGLSFFNYCLRYARWEYYLRRLEYKVPLPQSFAYYIAGFAFTTTPGKAGEAVRSIYLKRHHVSYLHSIAAFFSERIVDLFAMIILAISALLASDDFLLPVALICTLLLALIPLIHSTRLHLFIDRLLTRIPPGKLRSIGLRSLDLLGSASILLRSTPLYAGIAIALTAWGAEGVAFFVILESLDIETTIQAAVGIYSISILIGALSFIPGGLGSTEAVMVLLLKLIGADAHTAIAACLICRLATLWFAVIIGSFSLGALELNSKAAYKAE